MHSYQNYLQAFTELDSALAQHQDLWRPRPFQQLVLPWQASHPELYQALVNLSAEETQQLITSDEDRLSFFNHYLPQACTIIKRFKPEHISKQCKLTPFQTVGIPGRKLQQITAFASAINAPRGDIVDWCSGKGHLARVLHWQHHQTVHCLEFDKALCHSGKKLADKHQADLAFYHHDVLSPLPKPLRQANHYHVGLHACGQLHIELLKCASQQASHIALSPCCYHKIETEVYQPLSNSGSQGQLKLTRSDLHLPQEQTITGGQRIHKLREKEQLWRLGFDALQQKLQGRNNYLPLPSIQKRLLSTSFSDFCHWAAQQKQISLTKYLGNNPIDETHYLQIAQQRLQTIRRLELLRQLFQRPLELWLALDRTLFLFEQGYQAKLQTFCSPEVSPRNLLITAQQKS